MGSAVGSSFGAARCVLPTAAGGRSGDGASASPIDTHAAVLARLRAAPLVHPDTPDAFHLLGRASPSARAHAEAVARKAKTGDVILYKATLTGGAGIAQAFFAQAASALTGGPYTHAGIVLRHPSDGGGGIGADRAFVLESTLAPLAQGCDAIEGAAPSRLNGALRIFPLVGRTMAYNGNVFLLPLRETLSRAAEGALLRAATVVWRRNPDFDVEQLVAAGIDRLPLVRLLTGNRSEPEECLDAFFCSELVGHLLVVAGVLSPAVNVSTLAPNDLLRFSGALAVDALRPLKRCAAAGASRKVLALERRYPRTEDPAALMASLRTGDVLLVRSSTLWGGVIRVADRALWDHVAVVVRVPGDAAGVTAREAVLADRPLPASVAAACSAPAADQLQVLEATKEGTFAYPFRELLEARGDKYKYVGVRRLDPPLSAEQCARVEAQLLGTWWGRPYEQDLVQLCSVVALAPKALRKMRTEEDLSSIFCSELVAEVHQAAGVLPEKSLRSNELAPSGFMLGAAVDRSLVPSTSLGGRAVLLKAPGDDFFLRTSPEPRHRRTRRLPVTRVKDATHASLDKRRTAWWSVDRSLEDLENARRGTRLLDEYLNQHNRMSVLRQFVEDERMPDELSQIAAAEQMPLAVIAEQLDMKAREYVVETREQKT